VRGSPTTKIPLIIAMAEGITNCVTRGCFSSKQNGGRGIHGDCGEITHRRNCTIEREIVSIFPIINFGV
jgi:hypothetical protein